MGRFEPLHHLDLANQAVAVLSDYSKCLVDNGSLVDRGADVESQLVVVLGGGFLRVASANRLFDFGDELLVGHNLLLVLPKEHDREGDHQKAADKRPESEVVLVIVAV